MHELDAGEQWSLQSAHEAMDASSQPELAVGALRPVELAASKARGRSSESASREVWRPTELAAREQGSATAGACGQQVGGARWSVSRGSTGTRGEGAGERGWRERGDAVGRRKDREPEWMANLLPCLLDDVFFLSFFFV